MGDRKQPTPVPADAIKPEPPPAPPPRVCADCRFWKKDYGMFCMNGWTGMDRDDGHCHVEPRRIPIQGQTPACRYGERSL